MNVRIRQLAEQAWDSLVDEMGDAMYENRDAGELSIPFLHAYDKKFAELIVRECEQVSLKNSHRSDDMGAIIARQIVEYFGVK